MNTNRRHAVAALIAAGLLWGTTVPLSKLALEWLAPGWLTAVRFGLAAAVLLAVARRRGRGRGQAQESAQRSAQQSAQQSALRQATVDVLGGDATTRRLGGAVTLLPGGAHLRRPVTTARSAARRPRSTT